MASNRGRTRAPAPDPPGHAAGIAATDPARAHVLREPMFLRYTCGQAISLLGNQIWYVALAWTAVGYHSAALAGLLLTLSSLPRLTLLLLGGVVVDRHDIRRLMITADAARALLTLAAALSALYHVGIGLLVVLALSFGLADAVFLPAAGAMQPRLLRVEHYKDGAIVSTFVARLALAIGAPLGGLVVAAGGVPLALGLDAASFGVSVATLATVRPRAATTSPVPGPASSPLASYFGDLRRGLGFLFHHPVLRPLTLVTLATGLGFVGPMNVGAAELAETRGWGAAGIGVMLTGFGLGACAGGLAMTRIRVHGHVGPWIAGCAAMQGAVMSSLAFDPTPLAAALAAGCAGLCSGPMAVLGAVLTQQLTPDGFRGRVTSINTLLTLGVLPLTLSATGAGIAVFGLRPVFGVCGAIEALGLLALADRGFRQARIPASVS